MTTNINRVDLHPLQMAVQMLGSVGRLGGRKGEPGSPCSSSWECGPHWPLKSPTGISLGPAVGWGSQLDSELCSSPPTPPRSLGGLPTCVSLGASAGPCMSFLTTSLLFSPLPPEVRRSGWCLFFNQQWLIVECLCMPGTKPGIEVTLTHGADVPAVSK